MPIAGPVRQRKGLPLDADSTIRRQWLCCAGQEERCAVDRIEEYSGDLAQVSAAELLSLGRPVVLRGLAAAWPIVRVTDKAAYLRRFASGAQADMLVGGPEHEGRLFYTDGMAGLTFTKERASVGSVLDRHRSEEHTSELQS